MDNSEFKSLERWTCHSCKTSNTAFYFYCMNCHTPSPGDTPYVHIRNPTQETELPFQDHVELPFPTSQTIEPYKSTGYGLDPETQYAREKSSSYRPQPYNPAVPDKDTFGGILIFLLENTRNRDDIHFALILYNISN